MCESLERPGCCVVACVTKTNTNNQLRQETAHTQTPLNEVISHIEKGRENPPKSFATNGDIANYIRRLD